MKSVGVYEAKTHLARLLDEVERGECVVITRHGKPVARLQAVLPEKRSDDEVRKVLAEFEEFRAAHRGALRGLSVRQLIDEGRKY